MKEIEKSKTDTKTIIWISGFMGIVLGFILCAISILSILLSTMIVTKESKMDFDETVAKLQQKIIDQGWAVKDIIKINEEINKAGYEFTSRISLIKLCKAEYAKSILTTDPHISSMMPCTMAVWENDVGKVFLSEINMPLMAKLFGGNISKIMGGSVARDEEGMVKGLLK